MQLRSLIKKLKAENKVTELPEGIVQIIQKELNAEMSEVDKQLKRKFAISECETAKIIINS